MTREQQIEELGRVWESLHPGNRTDTGHCGHSFSFFSNCHPASAKDIKQVAEFFSFGTDTDDATPCLAILRDVKGEDWTITEQYIPGPCLDGSGGRREFVAHDYKRQPELPEYSRFRTDICRIHAVTLALEERS